MVIGEDHQALDQIENDGDERAAVPNAAHEKDHRA
jgi:hypothetical protein